MKHIALLAVLCLVLASSSGCCLFHGCGGCGGGYAGGGCCPTGGCGYGAGYGGGYGAVPGVGYTGTAMTAGAPIYAASAPIYAPTTALAPINPLPTY